MEVSAYRPLLTIKTWEINDIFKTSGQYDTATTNHDRNTNPNPNLKHFFAQRMHDSQPQPNDVSCLGRQ